MNDWADAYKYMMAHADTRVPPGTSLSLKELGEMVQRAQTTKYVQSDNPKYNIGVGGLHKEIRAELRKIGKSDDFTLQELTEYIRQRHIAVRYDYMAMKFEVVIPHEKILCRKDLVYAILDKIAEYESLWEE